MLKSKENNEIRFQQTMMEIDMITLGQHNSIKELLYTRNAQASHILITGMNIKTVRRHLKKEGWVDIHTTYLHRRKTLGRARRMAFASGYRR